MLKIYNQNITYKWIKDNISIVLLFPTITGGLWQLLELAFIETPYIRFFSISQLVPDGILILLVISLILLMTSSYTSGWRTGIKEFVNKKKELQSKPSKNVNESESTNAAASPKRYNGSYAKTKSQLLFFLLFSFGIPTIILLNTYSLIVDTFSTKTRAPFMGIISMSFVIALVLRLYTEGIWAILSVIKSVPGKRIMVAIIDLLVIVLFVSSLLFTFQFIRVFHHSFTFPSNSKNLEYISCQIKKKNVSMKSFEILYFNDKYIFVQVDLKDSISHVEVLKFEEFTNSSCLSEKK